MTQSKDMLSNLGLDVTLKSADLEVSTRHTKMLHDIGSERPVDGCRYIGSVAIHYYLDEAALHKTNYEMCSSTQIAFREHISENLAALGFNNAYIALRKHFNPQFKNATTRDGDLR